MDDAEIKDRKKIIRKGLNDFLDDHDLSLSKQNTERIIQHAFDCFEQENSISASAINNFLSAAFEYHQHDRDAQEGDDFFIASKIAEYRYIPPEFFTDQSFYVYGDKLALIAFEENNVRINIINNKSWAQSFRNLFNYAWLTAARVE